MSDEVSSPSIERRQTLDRIVPIDMLRGYAIIMIVLFHLWDDIRYLPYPQRWYYQQVGWRAWDGQWSRVPTSLLDAWLAGGYLVPLFMVLSGISLYMAAARKGGQIDRPTFYRRRLRQLFVPYWFGVGLVFAAICAIALAQLGLHGQTFMYQYHHVTEAKVDFVGQGRWELFAAVAVIPRLLRSEWEMVPPGVLWFVVLIAQYYLLFPFLLPLLERVKPLVFAGSALIVTITAKLTLIALAGGLDHNPAKHINHTLVPFRIFEFALGMSLGYLLVHQRDRLRAFVSPPRVIGTLLTGGVFLELSGTLIDDRSAYWSAFAAPMVIGGVALLALPLITKKHGRLEASAPARALAWVGPLTYAVLITNEPLRLVASFLRVEEVPTAIWWVFLVAYVPVTLAVAKPVASFLGLGRPSPTRSGPANSSALPGLKTAAPVGT